METLRRIVLKVSGEALAGDERVGLSAERLHFVASELAVLHAMDIRVGVVVGAGNIFRGHELLSAAREAGLKQTTADHIGMLGTVINALALRDALACVGVDARIYTPRGIGGVSDTFAIAQAKDQYERGTVLLCAGGTGNPLFTTDTAACLRGIELEADVVLKGTKVDGVYDEDPVESVSATRFARLSFDDVIQRNLRVMDLSAIAMCRDHNMPVVVYKLLEKGALRRILEGASVGTLVSRPEES